MNIRFLSSLLILLFLYANDGFSQNQPRRLSGIVLDKIDNKPLVGVSIIVKGSTNGTNSDADGKFQIEAINGQTLVFSYIGYENSETVISNSTSRLSIILAPSSNQLSEVVITGAFGIKRKSREVGVSSSSLSGGEITQAKIVNPLTGLQGKVAGLQVNMFDGGVNPQVRVTLRGARNISDSKNEPLFVVDGVPLPSVSYYNPQMSGNVRSASAISMLNPNDIEDMTVLKGANAAAIYGSQGVNGVILITTKQGKKGAGSINVSNTTTFERVGWLPEFQDQFGGGWNGVFQPYENRSWGSKYDRSMVKIGPVLADGSQWEVPYAPVKNQKRDFFDTGISSQNDISFSGGDERSTYFLSGQYVNTKGVIPKDKNTKASLRFNGSRKIAGLNTSYSLSYTQVNTSTTTSEPWNNVRNMPLYIPLSELKDYQNSPYAKPENYYSTTTINPYWGLDNQRQDVKQENVTGNVSLDYQITSWLKAIYRVGLTSVNSGFKSFTAKYDYSAIPYQYYDATGRLLTATRSGVGLSAAGSVSDQSLRNQQLNSDFLLQINKDFGKFSTHVLLGQNYQDVSSKSIALSASALNIPGTYNPDNRTGNLGGSSQILHQRKYAYFGELTVGYNNYLFATFNGRQEAISVLAANNRSYFYPGANLSLIFTEAIPGLTNNNIFSFGKIYTSASKTGNVTLDPYALQNVYNPVSGFPFGSIYGLAINASNANPDIRPEFVYSWETGLQLGLFKDRLKLEATYAYADSRDQIMDIATSYATGFGTGKYNAARMKSKSLELSANGDIISTNDWRLSLGVNYTHNDNRAVSLYGDAQMINQWKGLYVVPGERYPTFEVPDYQRDDQGRVIINAATGLPTQATGLTNKGTSQPVHMLGVNSQLGYKRIQLKVLVDARWGSSYYTAAAENTTTAGLAPASALNNREPFIYPNSVMQNADGTYSENTSVTTPNNYNFWNSYKNMLANNVFDARYIKLREISLSYDVPVKLFGQQKIVKNLSISAVGRNLVNLRAKSNIWGETEFIYLSGVGFSGWRTMPSTRSYGFNISAGF